MSMGYFSIFKLYFIYNIVPISLVFVFSFLHQSIVVSLYRFFTFVGKFAQVFYCFWCCYEWDSFIFFSDVLLLVYRNATYFYRLILYPMTLLNLLISSSRFFFFFLVVVESLRFNRYKIILSANNDNFISSFFIWIPFISFSCLIALAQTSSTILNKSGDSGHPCLVPDLRGKLLIFHHCV